MTFGKIQYAKDTPQLPSVLPAKPQLARSATVSGSKSAQKQAKGVIVTYMVGFY
jgi:hypothetical protein